MTEIEKRIKSLGMELPPAPEPNGLYKTSTIVGGILMTSGQLSREGTGLILGPISKGDDIDVAFKAAQICVLRCFSVAKEGLDSLDQINKVVALRGFIAASPDFQNHSRVLDKASELIIQIMGNQGRHIRTAVGVSSLPSGGLVEIEMSFVVTQN